MDQSQVQQQKEAEFQQLLKQWEDEHQTNGYDPQPFLTKVAEFIEHETEMFLKMDPDPFDDRHPSRVDPTCGLGFALKYLFRKENFMTKLVNDYLRETYWSRQNMGIPGDQRSFDLNVAACRLMLDIMPGLDTSAVFQDMDSQILKLFSWAENSVEPLQSYATGMLAAAMEVSDIAANFREQNAKLVPLMLKRLHDLQQEHLRNVAKDDSLATSRPFAHLGQKSSPASPSKLTDITLEPPLKKRSMPPSSEQYTAKSPGSLGAAMQYSSLAPPHDTPPNNSPRLLNGDQSPPFRRLSTDVHPAPVSPAKDAVSQRVSQITMTNDCSNSSWAEMESFVIGSFQMYPVTLATKQILILRYLTPVGEYQEFLGFVFEHTAMQLILKYTNLKESRDARLAFEALKYLGALLCHKKFSFEFINSQRMQHLMDIRRPSIAACGVAMCLYHMSYCEDTMERICLLPHYIIHQVVRYALWLLECSHDSSRCHAVMFFILALPFQVILEEFDNQDGLRKVYNVVSTQALLSSDDSRHLNEDEQCAARQIIRHSFMCFKRYFETHLAIRAEAMRRASVREQSCTGPDQVPQAGGPAYKPLRPSPEQVQEYVDTLLELMSIRAHWAPVEKFINLGGIALLLKVIAYAYEWNYSGRAETVRSALDTLAVCAVMPKAQLQLCDSVDLPFDSISMGMNIILGAAEGEIVADADVQRSALHVIAHCVCAPEHRMGGSVGRFAVASVRKKAYIRNSEDVIFKMWDSVRTNNGIMVLLQLMTVKARLTEADSIRMLACRALAGLARSETVRQIIGKLTLVTDGQLQILMRDPILQDRRQEHVQFQKYAVQLLERVSGKPGCNELEASVQHIHRANVVAQTRIQYNEQQLYQLIHEHLLNKGLNSTARQLKEEARLPDPPPANQTPARPAPASAFPSTVSHRGSAIAPTTPPTSRIVSRVGRCPGTPRSTSIDKTAAPIKLSLSMSRRAELLQTRSEPSRILQKQTSYENNPTLAGSSTENRVLDSNGSAVSLQGIVTEYLKNQHALCKNPVATCPQFNLFKPHKCPDPRERSKVTVNFAMRLPQRHLWPPYGGPDAARLDRRLVHSRFCPVKTFRMGKEDAFFTCAAFDPQDQRLMLGTFEGQMKMFNLHTGSEEASYQCHDSYVYRLEPSRNGKLLLTSSTWRRPLSALFSLGQFFQMQYPFDEEEYVEFSKVTQCSIIGTKAEVASIYDVETGRKLSTLRPEISNNYTKNRATYSPTDELVLSDGVLWDVGGNKPIHKFDKLNQTLSGVFHPNGLEVVSNTEVWDLRTFHLLRTVPALDQCELRFTPRGDVLYCVSMEAESDEDSSFESSFKTLDAKDYSSIATIDVKRNIYDLAVNNAGTQLALVENQGMFESVQESSARLYDIGRKRDDEDEGEEEDDEDNMDGSNDDGSSSSSASDDDNDALRGAGLDGGEAGGREQEEDGDQSSVDSDWETQSSAHGSNNDSDLTGDDDDSIVSRIFANLLNNDSP